MLRDTSDSTSRQMPGRAVGRFAPSPTGHMHLGNARTALLAWLQIRYLQGHLILRIEDVDRSRVRAFAYEALYRDLAWLGLDWDQVFIQSERQDYYVQAIRQLETYGCSCSRKDIQEAASAPHGLESGRHPQETGSDIIYPGTCRQGPTRVGRPLARRWCIPALTIQVEDLRLGSLSQFLPEAVGDIVLQRNDGCFAYHLAVVVDDALMGVSHVLRGEDLWPATPVQVALQQALGYNTPHYLHVPLMTDYLGQRLAKRQGAPSVSELRESGISPHRILARLAQSLGWQVDAEVSPDELLTAFGARVHSGSI